MLDGHQPLSEVMRWDLEDVRKMNALMDMREAHAAAADEYQTRKIEEAKLKNGN